MGKKQFGVIGLGTFGSNVAKELAAKEFPVLAIDNKETVVNRISPFVTQAIVADATDDIALKDAGIADCDTVIISMGEDIETSILATLIAKDLGVKNVIVKCVSPWHSKIAVKIGADKVVYPELEMVEIITPEILWGKTIKDSGIRNKYGINVIAIKRQVPFINDDGQTDIKEETNVAPGPDDEILENDILVVVGKQEQIDKLKKL